VSLLVRGAPDGERNTVPGRPYIEHLCAPLNVFHASSTVSPTVSPPPPRPAQSTRPSDNSNNCGQKYDNTNQCHESTALRMQACPLQADASLCFGFAQLYQLQHDPIQSCGFMDICRDAMESSLTAPPYRRHVCCSASVHSLEAPVFVMHGRAALCSH